MKTPYDWQFRVLSDVDLAWQRVPNVLLRADTGAGKTLLLSHIVRNHAGASCVMAHRHQLVLQLSLTLADQGVYHDIIASAAVRRIIAAEHVAKFGKCYYRPGALAKVASVDTLVRAKGLESWAKQVTLAVVDECFPAGTLVDGRPIESLQVGDSVTAFNEKTGTFEPRRVVRLFRNPMPQYMVRIETSGHHVVSATSGHPFWTQRGWVDAAQLTTGDRVLLDVRGVDKRNGRVAKISVEENRADLLQQEMRLRVPNGKLKTPSETGYTDRTVRMVRDDDAANREADLLRSNMLGCLSVDEIERDDGSNQPTARLRSDENEQPDAPRRQSREDAGDYPRHGSPTDSSWGERSPSDEGRTDAFRDVRMSGLYDAVHSSDQAARNGLSESLQDRLRQSDAENSDRGGRQFAQQPESQGVRRTEGCVSEWVGLASVEVYESSDSNGPEYGVGDGYVYNIEVDGLHTYIANDIVVHNCHHLVKDNKWSRAIAMFTHSARRMLLPTATPERADGKGLGSHADGYADEMVQAPPMRWLIENGYLSDYDIVCPTSDIVMLSDPTGEAGDYSPKQLRDAARRSHIVGDVVKHYQQFAGRRRCVTFCTDVETANESCAAFNLAGIPTAVMTGDTDPALRRKMIESLERGTLLNLCAVDIISEGFDLPAIEVVIMARPTQSLALYMQQFGRALRIMLGKTKALIIDCVSNVVTHGLPDRPRVWSLNRRDKKAKTAANDATKLRICPGDPDAPLPCLKPYERFLPACPFCGYEPQPAGRSAPEQVDGDLTLLDAAVLHAMRQAIDMVDAPPAEERARLAARYVPEIGIAAGVNRHVKRQAGQTALRDMMARWGGYRYALGEDYRTTQRLFYALFGVDVMTAQTLGPADAEALRLRIDEAVNSG